MNLCGGWARAGSALSASGARGNFARLCHELTPRKPSDCRHLRPARQSAPQITASVTSRSGLQPGGPGGGGTTWVGGNAATLIASSSVSGDAAIRIMANWPAPEGAVDTTANTKTRSSTEIDKPPNALHRFQIAADSCTVFCGLHVTPRPAVRYSLLTLYDLEEVFDVTTTILLGA